VGRWEYHDADGKLVGLVVRWDTENGKTFLPFSLTESAAWVCEGMPTPRPVYRLPAVLSADGSIYVAEGEKAADALVSLGLNATTSPNGSKSAAKADWSPLRGRRVVIVPDRDDSGERYSADVASLARAAGAESVVVVRLADHWPELPVGGDAADWIECHDAAEPDDLRQAVEALVARANPYPENSPAVMATLEARVTSAPSSFGPARIDDPRTLNDTGFARRLLAESKGEILYVHDRRTWVRWDGCKWVDDWEALHAQRIAKRIPAMLLNEAKNASVAGNGPGVSAAMRMFNRKGIESAVALARSEPLAHAVWSDFDRQPHYLNCTNGTLDLAADGGPILHPHRKEDRLTKSAAVGFDPVARCPRWERFIGEVMRNDAELASFLQRSCGIALTSDQSEQRLWVHHGDGGNGKGVFLSTIAKVLGTYAGPVSADLFVSRGPERERDLKVGQLIGKRLAYAQEADEGARLSESTVKAMTGSDACTARLLYQDAFTVTPTWHIHLAVNHRPTIKGMDAGIWRRLLLVPWKAVFVGPANRNRAALEAELFEEGPGILNWMIEGLRAWQRNGLMPPEAVSQAIRDYRDSSDSISSWLVEECVSAPDASAAATDLYESYKAWCCRAGFDAVTQACFGRVLEDRGYTKTRPTAGEHRNKTVRLGLGFLPGRASQT
jgi:putative DNA primase/helicase